MDASDEALTARGVDKVVVVAAVVAVVVPVVVVVVEVVVLVVVNGNPFKSEGR